MHIMLISISIMVIAGIRKVWGYLIVNWLHRLILISRKLLEINYITIIDFYADKRKSERI